MEPSSVPVPGRCDESQRLPARVVLLVDDDDIFRTALAESLREDGYCVQAYATPGDIPPLPLLDDVAVLITDYEMPGEDGLAFAKRFHGFHPGVPVIMVTAYCGIRLEHEDAAADFLSLRCKPIDYEELHQLVRQAQRRVQCERTSTS